MPECICIPSRRNLKSIYARSDTVRSGYEIMLILGVICNLFIVCLAGILTSVTIASQESKLVHAIGNSF